MSFVLPVISTTEYVIAIVNGSLSDTVTVAEDLNYSTIDILGWESAGLASGPGDGEFWLTVAGSIITATRAANAGSLNIRLRVTQFSRLSMLQIVQRGTVALVNPSLSVDSAAYIATGAKAAIRAIGIGANIGSGSLLANPGWFGIFNKKNNTQVTFTGAVGFEFIAAFEVVDWR